MAERKTRGGQTARSGDRARRPGDARARRRRDRSQEDAARGVGDEQNGRDTPPPAPWTLPWLIEWAKTLAFAAVIFLVLRTFIVESFVISSGSMERTLLVGDFLLVNKTVFGSPIPFTPWRVPGYAEPERGEIIVFRADHAPGLDIVKRVIGVPGDTLAMREGILLRNGEPQDEPYVVHDASVPDSHHPDMDWQRRHLVDGGAEGTYRPTRDDWGPIVVPPERYFMLGDNREHSLDSRFWGLVERRKVKGKPFVVYYSYDKEVLRPFPFVTAARPERIGLFPP